jgi:hypothetical protein
MAASTTLQRLIAAHGIKAQQVAAGAFSCHRSPIA